MLLARPKTPMSVLLKRSILMLAFVALGMQRYANPPTSGLHRPVSQADSQSKQQNMQVPPAPNAGASDEPASLRDQAWNVLEASKSAQKAADRVAVMHSAGLILHNERARKIAEAGLLDDSPEVRASAAAALGDMGASASLPKLRAATGDKDASVALAAAHALLTLHDNSGYEVYYQVLTEERKTGKGPLAEAAALKDPKKLAALGFEQALGFVPFGGMGVSAFKALKKNDASPARAAAATVLAKDPDSKTASALVDAAGDKNWIVRAAVLEALAKRGDPSVLKTVKLYLMDQEGEVKYVAAGAALHLLDIQGSKGKVQKK